MNLIGLAGLMTLGICLENDEDEYIVDENDEYSLIYKYDGSGTYELRDSHNKVIGITEYDTIEEAYKLGNQHGLEYKVKRTDLLES